MSRYNIIIIYSVAPESADRSFEKCTGDFPVPVSHDNTKPHSGSIRDLCRIIIREVSCGHLSVDVHLYPCNVLLYIPAFIALRKLVLDPLVEFKGSGIITVSLSDHAGFHKVDGTMK